MNRRIIYCLLIIFFINSTRVNAQLIAGNAFLQGNFVRLGLAPNAAFGSNTNPDPFFLPPGADIRNSPGCNLGKIGFVADYQKDGWTTGTPAYMGEYFLAGQPEEGWAISLNGTDYNNNRNPVATGPPSDLCTGGAAIPGAFTLFEDLADRQVAHWEGMINGLKIIKKITLPKNKLYFITEIKLVNTTGALMSDVYYMRNVDPDNEVVPTNSYTTFNRIEYQNPVSANKALVSARGTSYGSFLGLGTIDCRARVVFGSSNGSGGGGLANRSPRDVYNGTLGNMQSALNASITSDIPIAVSFKIGDIAPLDTARLAFAYILSIEDLEEALSKTAPQFNVAGINVVSGGAAINCDGTPTPIDILNGEDYSWVWSPATGLNTTTGPSVIYTPQPVPVTYTITGTNAVCNDATLTITIYPPSTPVAFFDENVTCGNRTVAFTNESLTLSDPLSTYVWDFGDGSPTSTATHPSHTYTAFGTYDVTLIVLTDALTCGDDTIITKTIEISDKPIPSVNISNNACVGNVITMTGSATITVGSVVSHEWRLPGGITYHTPSITHTFSAGGTFDVIYKVTSDRGCVDSVIKQITVETTPVVSFDASNGCENTTIGFTNNTTNLVGAITNYEWDFGNGNTSFLQSPTTTYSSFGNKTITLKASTINGCSDTYSTTIDIESTPIAEFEFDKACPGTPIPFTNLSSNVYGSIIGYEWTFEPGQTSTLLNPAYTFFTDGNYPVTLKAFTANGCESVLKTHTIPIRTVKADAGKDTLVFKDSPFQLKAKGGKSYLWSPSIYLNANDIANPVGSVTNDQLFTVEVTDERGCKATATMKVTVFVEDDIYVPTSFTPNNDGKNDVFRVIAPPGTVYLFEVYNRWGQKLFSTNNQTSGWNGKLQNLLQPSGMYVWYLKAKTRQGRQVEKKGTVMLIW